MVGDARLAGSAGTTGGQPAAQSRIARRSPRVGETLQRGYSCSGLSRRQYPGTSNRGQKAGLHEVSQNFTLGVAFCCSVASKYSAFPTPAMLQKDLPKKERA